jgi:hypothetical protein
MENTWQGQAAMVLARALDSGKHGGAGGAAGASRGLKSAMDFAYQSSSVDDADVIDLLFREADAEG